MRAYHSRGGKTYWDDDFESRSTCDGEYIQRLINERIIPEPSEARAVARQGSLRKALEMAIKMEQDSITLYEEMLDGASPPHIQVLREIIQEERQHVHDLVSGTMIL
jgi:rubrerythrin